jgi:hypothetical protein
MMKADGVQLRSGKRSRLDAGLVSGFAFYLWGKIGPSIPSPNSDIRSIFHQTVQKFAGLSDSSSSIMREIIPFVLVLC